MLITEIKSILKEDEEVKPGMTLYDYIVNVCDGEIDMDVSDKDIDMTVAFCHDVNSKDNEYPEMERFLNLIAKRTKIVKQVEGPYEPILICDFSSALKPYNEQWKEIFDMDNSEFDEDEAYYEAVVNLEPLISGNAGESTYKEIADVLEGKTKETSFSSYINDNIDDFSNWFDDNVDFLADNFEAKYHEEPVDSMTSMTNDKWDEFTVDEYEKEKKKSINESQEQADDAYYKVNDVALKLQEVKPLIKEGTEADKLYTDIMLKLNELQMSLHNEKLNEEDTSSLENKVVVFGGPGSDFGVLYSEDVGRWKAGLKRRNIEILDITDDKVFTVRGKIKDIYDFYNKIVANGSFGIDYNNIEEFANWAGLLDKSSQDKIISSVAEKVQDEVDWKALKDGLNACSNHNDIFGLMKKTMSSDTYVRYASRFSRRQKPNSYVMYWPYSFNKMKEVLEKEADKNINKEA